MSLLGRITYQAGQRHHPSPCYSSFLSLPFAHVGRDPAGCPSTHSLWRWQKSGPVKASAVAKAGWPSTRAFLPCRDPNSPSKVPKHCLSGFERAYQTPAEASSGMEAERRARAVSEWLSLRAQAISGAPRRTGSRHSAKLHHPAQPSPVPYLHTRSQTLRSRRTNSLHYPRSSLSAHITTLVYF